MFFNIWWVECFSFVYVTLVRWDLRQMQESTVSMNFTYIWQDLKDLSHILL